MSEAPNSKSDSELQKHLPSGTRWGARLVNLFGRGVAWQTAAFIFCLLFGICLTFQVLGAGDCVWFWYSTAFLEGKKLYADLHFVQQPLFVLETALTMKLFGLGWLVSRLPAVFHVLAYCVALLILVRISKLSDARKALLLACSFSVSISFGAYRFDDYHTLCDSFVLYAVIAILFLQKATSKRTRFLLLVAVGACNGLALVLRLNDGGALFVGVALALLLGVPRRPFSSLLLVVLVMSATILLVVHLTGDSLHDYLAYSVFKAAGSKGGVGHVLLDPLLVPLLAITWLIRNASLPILGEATGIALSWQFLVSSSGGQRRTYHKVLASVGVLLVLLCSRQTKQLILSDLLLSNLSGLVAIVIFPVGIWIVARSARRVLRPLANESSRPEEILLLIPIGQFASGSMSSGGYFVNLWQPLAVIMLLLPLCSPVRLRKAWPREFLFALVALLMLSTVVRRVIDPYSWHSYREKPLFAGRTWYRHPVYGPMIVDRDLLAFIQPVCNQVALDGSGARLLSLPFPFANYFCGVPPWHGYVQTFYDTSSRQTIEQLKSQLEVDPPKWILYQKQMNSLQWHEILYNHGQPLAQRDLDELIEQKIARNEWHVVYASDYGNSPGWDSHWQLIQTQ